MMECEIALGVDSEVVHIDLKPTLSDHICEYVIHKGLKRRWSVAKAKEHNGGFKKPERSDERSFPLVFFTNADVIKSPSDVKFGEYVWWSLSCRQLAPGSEVGDKHCEWCESLGTGSPGKGVVNRPSLQQRRKGRLVGIWMEQSVQS